MGSQSCAQPRGFVAMTKVLNLKVGDDPGLSQWTQSNHINS